MDKLTKKKTPSKREALVRVGKLVYEAALAEASARFYDDLMKFGSQMKRQHAQKMVALMKELASLDALITANPKGRR